MAKSPEQLAREVIELCTNCDQCRNLLADTPCLFFPKLYRLHDTEKSGKRQIGSNELRTLVGLCNMCGLCSCPPIRAKIREAKDGFTARAGFKPGQRILMDVRLLGRIGAVFPRLINLLFHTEPLARLLKRLIGIHPERKIPAFPRQPFTAWAKARGIVVMRPAAGRKVAYFVGCSAQYLFPDIAKATVEVLQRNGVSVFVPDQVCCGMPRLLEGDRRYAFDAATFNMGQLAKCIDAGYDIVTSCPTCGYMFKSLLPDGANYSEGYRAKLAEMLAEEGGNFDKLCQRAQRDEESAVRAINGPPCGKTIVAIKLTLGGLCRDEGYFASLDPHDRMKIARHTFDLGEFLRIMQHSQELNGDLGPLPEGMVYYPPCHLKEQEMGYPWRDLLELVPGVSLPTVGGAFDCCGSAGIRGFQTGFHKASLAQGKRLMEKIRARNPETIVTDCLSCRIQFNQALPYPVSHPVEMLNASYRSGGTSGHNGKD